MPTPDVLSWLTVYLQLVGWVCFRALFVRHIYAPVHSCAPESRALMPCLLCVLAISLPVNACTASSSGCFCYLSVAALFMRAIDSDGRVCLHLSRTIVCGGVVLVTVCRRRPQKRESFCPAIKHAGPCSVQRPHPATSGCIRMLVCRGDPHWLALCVCTCAPSSQPRSALAVCGASFAGGCTMRAFAPTAFRC